MFTRITPALAVANWSISHSTQFGLQMPRRSPGSRPAAISARASRSTPSFSSAYVKLTPWCLHTIASAPGDPSHIYVTELGGTIKVLDNGVEHTFLDISTEVAPRFDSDPEQGLLSIAFAPDFATSKKFFVYYSSNACSGADYTRGCDN